MPSNLDTLTRSIHESGCSIHEARFTRFGDHIGILAEIVGKWNAIAKLEGILARLNKEGTLQIVSARSTRKNVSTATIPYFAELIGVDHPGVLADIVHFFIDHDITIEDLHATTYRAPYSETLMGSVYLTVGLPSALSLATIRGEFADLCDELNIDGMFAPVK